MSKYDWQRKAFAKYFQFDSGSEHNFLVVATPGSGKTKFALSIAKELLKRGDVERLVVVVPSEQLKHQWSQVATEFDIRLDPKWKAEQSHGESKDFHGICCTYAAVGRNPSVLRSHTEWRSTLVICDEIHHASEDATWGDALFYAFERCPQRLLLSGTPWTSTGKGIPFINYDANNTPIPDVTFDFGQAVSAKVCREVAFMQNDGEAEFKLKGVHYCEKASAKLPENIARARLRTLVSADGDWLPSILVKADGQLRELQREGHPQAAGIVMCTDQAHARAVHKFMQSKGMDPVLVISEDANALSNIKQFTKNWAPWIVTVKMVSEGVDIPRLRVLVFASNFRTELFYLQAIGRIVRTCDDGDRKFTAYVFQPVDEELEGFAGRILEIQRVAKLQEPDEPGPTGGNGSAPSDLEIIGSSDAEHVATVIAGTSYLPIQITAAQDLMYKASRVGSEMSLEQALKILYNEVPTVSKLEPARPLYEERDALRKKQSKLVQELVSCQYKSTSLRDIPKEAYPKVWAGLKSLDGCGDVNNLTVEQLKYRIQELEGAITSLRRG